MPVSLKRRRASLVKTQRRLNARVCSRTRARMGDLGDVGDAGDASTMLWKSVSQRLKVFNNDTAICSEGFISCLEEREARAPV
jgi:hypothetical protein